VEKDCLVDFKGDKFFDIKGNCFKQTLIPKETAKAANNLLSSNPTIYQV
jgi:hypothetical protein